MILWIKKHYFKLQIKVLLFLKPAVFFDRLNQLAWYKNTLQHWVDDQHFTTQHKVLEVGCSTGILTAYIAQLCGIVNGVDYSSKMIDLAKINHDNIDFSVADVLDIPFENKAFDYVIAASLLNIISDKNKAISELSRVCKKGGIVSILVPSVHFNDADLCALQTSLNHSGFSAAAMDAWHNLAPKMATDDIFQLFKQAGLTEISSQYYLQGMVIAVSAVKS
jgi:ubiquinone/menaquinone biosynthesis C-methylase UbiE